MEKNICVYNWVTLLYNGDWQNIVTAGNQLYLEKKKMQQFMSWPQSGHHAVRFSPLVAIIVSAKHLRNMHETVICILQFSRSVMSASFWPQGLQYFRLPYPSAAPVACSNSRPSNRRCHPTISSSVVTFSSRLQSCSASGSFPMSQFLISGGQSIGFSFSISPSNEHSGLISFSIDWFDLLAVQRTL